MKNLFYTFAGMLILFSCYIENKDRQKKQTIDSPEKRFFLSIIPRNLSDTMIFITINPSVCGACDDEFINYIKNINIKNRAITFLMSTEKFKINKIIDKINNSKVVYPSYEKMERHGLIGPYNKIYFVNKNDILARYSIIPENYQIITDYLIDLDFDN